MLEDIRTEPLFVPGEEVGVSGLSHADKNTSRTVVRRVNYIITDESKDWWYGLQHARPEMAFRQGALVKLHRNNKTTWSTGVWAPN